MVWDKILIPMLVAVGVAMVVRAIKLTATIAHHVTSY